MDKVYSVALRHTRNAHAAEEITQAVFVILAKKSGRLGAKVILAGWLYETARLTALTYIRSEIRRVRREQEAHMQTTLNRGGDASSPSDQETVWPHISPLLDDALAKLSAADRHAIVLRYFDGKSLGEVGAALGASEDAAKKRVTRAVEKLRGWFTKRGVTLTATVLTTAISANSVQAAPLGLAATVTATAAKGAAVSGSTLTLIKGALKIMAWMKMKTAAVIGVSMLLAAGTATAVFSTVNRGDAEARRILERTMEKYSKLQSYRGTGTTVEEISDGRHIVINGTFSMTLGRPDVYRLEYEQVGPFTTNRAGLWADASGHYFKNLMSKDPAPLAPDDRSPVRYEMKLPFTGMAGIQHNLGDLADSSGGVTAIIPSMFYGAAIPKLNSYVWSTMSAAQGWIKSTPSKEPDESVDGIDCYALSITTDEGKAWLWIGKQDGLIHQSCQRRNYKLSEMTDKEVIELLKENPSKSSLSVSKLKRRINEARRLVNETGKPATANFDLSNGQSGINAITFHPPGFRVRTQMHQNIVLNEDISPADFAH